MKNYILLFFAALFIGCAPNGVQVTFEDENSNKIHEAADVLYHLIMYLESNDIKIEDVMSELKSRKK